MVQVSGCMGDNKQADNQGVSKNTPEHTVDLQVAPCDGSETDSDCEHKFVFPLRHELPPHDYLRFILTVWYSPETSSSIAGKFNFLLCHLADMMTRVYNEAQLKVLLTSPMDVVLMKSRKFFLELNI
ncbi:unnamed protein product [Schistocephalus solidus]|uniref:BTB domain-containing protein n=1 Tax=Schistocephalus solidus TaxID=70667 RepID=A0A183SNZ5_SCHSO|nr:unnamed protein product [Schistocephalus solidus]